MSGDPEFSPIGPPRPATVEDLFAALKAANEILKEKEAEITALRDALKNTEMGCRAALAKARGET